MGNILNRSRDDEVQEDSVDQSSNPHGNHGYLYNPRNGFYFGSHFIMGGEKFETGSPETYLFGDNLDLNFLGPKPIPFPYLAPLPDEPTRSLRVLVNIRKETLRFIKCPSKACQNNQFSLSDISSNIIIPTTNGNGRFTTVNSKTTHSKKFPSKGSVGNIQLDHHELKEIPSSSNSTAVLPTTSSPQELSKSNASSSSSLNSSIKPAQTQLQETNRLLENSSPTETVNPITTPVSSSNTPASPSYNIEFTFDSDVKCSVTIYYLAIEESTPSGNIYVPRDPTYKTETHHYPMGAGQIFSHPSLIFNPNSFSEDDLAYRAFDEYGNFDPTIPYPIVIQLNAEEGTEPRQSHSLIATCERNNEKQFYIKPFKQKIVIDGLSYLIQEVYGIENKNPVYSTSSTDKPAFYSSDEEIEDNGSECVICMSESRDTLILPCRHLCLCNACADSLRYQANNCPICRSPFRALLQFRAVRKINNAQSVTTINEINAVTQSSTEPLNTSSSSTNNNNQRSKHTSARPTTTTSTTNQTNNGNSTQGDDTKSDIPPGYESISLVEALNGPTLVHSSSRPGEFGLYAFQSGFDDEDVAPLASIEATTKSFSGSSQSMVATKSSRDRRLNGSSNSSNTDSNQHSRYHHVKSSFSSLADIRYPTPSSSSSPKLDNRSKSISKSKFSMMADTKTDQRSGGNGNNARSGSRKDKKENATSSESLTLWSQQESPDSVDDDQEKVKLLDSHSNQQQSKYHPIQSRQLSEPQPSSANKESSSSKSRRNYRKRGSTYNDSELKALNSSSSRESPSHHHESERDSIDGIDIDSINLTSTSYPDLFLLDGVDEQRFMDKTDILSVTTVDSVPNENSQQTD